MIDTLGDNGKVSIAVLNTKLDNIIATLSHIEKEIEEHNTRMLALEQSSGRREEQINNLRTVISHLQNRDTIGTVGTGLLAVLAGIIALFAKW